MLICKLNILYECMHSLIKVLFSKLDDCIYVHKYKNSCTDVHITYIAKHVSFEYGLQLTTLLVAKQPDNLKQCDVSVCHNQILSVMFNMTL